MSPEQAELAVFVVDDDPGARSSVAALIQSHGMKVRPFASAKEFLAAYNPAQTGCLVVDVRMAGMTGLELQEELRSRGSTLPVIVITGYADVPMAVRAMRAGAVTFLQKPCADNELWASIETALRWSERSHQLRAERNAILARRAMLTPPEVQVLEKLMAGKANKVVASELDLGLRTVELRRATVMKKMHADSLAELVRLILITEGAGESEGTKRD